MVGSTLKASLLRPALTVALVLIGIYALVCLAALVFQERLIYLPGGPPELDPSGLGLEYDDLWLVTADGVRIHAWLIHALPGTDEARLPAPQRAKGALVFSHGNAGNIQYRLSAARAFATMGYSVLLYDYRGYGSSEGRPDEEGTYRDAEAAYAYLVEEAGFEAQRVISYGESLGGAVAVELARRRPVAGVVVEDTFTSMVEMGSEVYPWLPVRLLSRVHYATLAKLNELDTALLVLHSPEDEVIPYAHGVRLYDAAGDPKQFLATEGGHNDGGFAGHEGYSEKVRGFLDAALEGRVETKIW